MVVFPVFVEFITDGYYYISIAGLPEGVFVPEYLRIEDSQTELVLSLADTGVGIFNLSLTVYDEEGNAIATSNIFTLTIYTPFQEMPQEPLPQPTIQQSILRFAIGSLVYTANDIPHTSDVAPFIDPAYDRTMLPLRVVAEALGVQVEWLEETRTVLIISDGGEFALAVDAPLPGGMGMPMLRDGRTFVPLRYVAEMLGATVRWDGENMAVYVYQYNMPNPSNPGASIPTWFAIN